MITTETNQKAIHNKLSPTGCSGAGFSLTSQNYSPQCIHPHCLGKTQQQFLFLSSCPIIFAVSECYHATTNSLHLTLLVSSVEVLAGAGGIVPPMLFSKLGKKKKNNKIIKTMPSILLTQVLLIISAFYCHKIYNNLIHCKSS